MPPVSSHQTTVIADRTGVVGPAGGPGGSAADGQVGSAGALQDCAGDEAVLAEFTAQRRAALPAVLERGRDRGELDPDADLDMLVDMAYGVLWYRLLVGHAPLDDDTARRLAGRLIAAGAGEGS